MLPAVNLGSLAIPTRGLVVIMGIWLLLSALERAGRALRLDAGRLYSVGVLAILAGFLAGRLAFVGLHWSAYQDNLLAVAWPLTGGFNLWGGLAGALLAAAFGLRAARLPATAALDAAAPALLVGLLALSLADFLAGPGYGSESSLPWAVSLFGIRRHPVQVYEIGVGLLTLWAWLAWRPSRPAPGRLFLLSAAVYAAGRLFVDAFRADSPLTAGGYHLVQIACLVVLLLAVALLGRAGPTSAPAAPEPQGPSFAKPH